MKTTTLILVIAAVFAGCSKDKAKVATTTPTEPDKPPTPEKKAPEVAKDTQVSPGIHVSGDVASLCGLKASQAEANPKFDYNKDDLTKDDRAVLDQIATCMMTGPLKGKAVSLIGRADPRGTEEYNLGLGSRRAGMVSQYLARLGVNQPQLAVTTRGALEATGTDEAGWKSDRRVDVQLKQD